MTMVVDNGATASESARYLRWSGELKHARWTWLAIVTTGVRIAYRRSHMPLFLMMSVMFVIFTCVVFYILALLEELVGTDQAAGAYEFVRTLLGVDLSGVRRLAESLDSALDENAFDAVFTELES